MHCLHGQKYGLLDLRLLLLADGVTKVEADAHVDVAASEDEVEEGRLGLAGVVADEEGAALAAVKGDISFFELGVGGVLLRF